MWGMLAAVGLASDGTQPDMGVAWPLKTVEKIEEAEELTEQHFAQCLQQVHDKDWEIVPSFQDPEEGGDMRFWSRPAVGRYQYVKITMTMRGTTCQKIFDLVQSDDIAVRQQFSADICQLETLEKNEKVGLYQMAYAAPPGVANREFVVLGGVRTVEEGVMVAWGCSVDTPKAPEQSVPVRGATQYAWHVTQVGDDVLVSWCNCFDPRGWTPQFLLSWMKSAVTNEFVNIRSVISGKKANLHATGLEISEEEVKKQKAEAGVASPNPQ